MTAFMMRSRLEGRRHTDTHVCVCVCSAPQPEPGVISAPGEALRFTKPVSRGTLGVPAAHI